MNLRPPIFLALLLFASLPAFADRIAQVREMLTGYEWHVDASAFAKLGPDVYKDLLALAENPEETGVTRARAIAVLSLYRDDSVWNFFARAVSTEEEPSRRTAIVDAMCEAFVTQRPADVAGTMIPLLEARDLHVRVRAARCLRRIDSDRVLLALENYRGRIKNDWEFKAAGFGEHDDE
ncbi:MAG: hypothetical protein KDI19_07825 [Pseudomonadales bacterium]|nr:hypothetical protein [Pseudomonadales bacterium]